MTNEIVSTKPKFSVVIHSDGIKNLINKTLGDEKKAQRFVASICSAVATNPQLQECDPQSVISSALLGEALALSPSPQLANYYLVPYKNNKTGRTDAQFQLGWKGLFQLAIRSGQYKTINVLPIKEGELVSYDPLNEEIEVNMITDDTKREEAKTIGYYASFTTVNGFKKVLYWSKEKMLAHADRYSKAFNKKDYEKVVSGLISEKDMWKYSSPWYTMTDEMGCKTVLKQLLSKYGILSIEMQEAVVKDQAVIREDNIEYVDNADYQEKQVEEEQPKEEPQKKSLSDVE